MLPCPPCLPQGRGAGGLRGGAGGGRGLGRGGEEGRGQGTFHPPCQLRPEAQDKVNLVFRGGGYVKWILGSTPPLLSETGNPMEPQGGGEPGG